MADALTPLPVKTKTAGDVAAKIVDSAGVNLLAVDASGRLTVNLTQEGGVSLTAAAALSDAFANPTPLLAGAFILGWNGSTWDRLKSSTARGLQVDLLGGGGVAITASAALADALANPTPLYTAAFNMGWNGSNWDRLKSTTARGLQVDLLGGGGVALTASAALSDAFANPTPLLSGAFLLGYNGSTWDRLRTTTARGLQVELMGENGVALTATASLTDAYANPTPLLTASFLMGYNGATWDRLRATATGILKVDASAGGAMSVSDGVTTATTAAWTSATSINTTLQQTVTNYATVAVSFNETDSGTAVLNGGIVTFEVSDDSATTWYPVQAFRTDAAVADPTYAVIDGKRIWNVNITGFTTFRVRLSTVLSQGAGTGTATANIRVQASSAACDLPVGAGAMAGETSNPKLSTLTSAALAAGGNVTLNGTDITAGRTGRLLMVTASASVPLKVEIGTFTGAALTDRVVLFTSAASPIAIFSPENIDFISQAGGSGNNFAVKLTNTDNTQAADVYTSVMWSET